MSLRDTLKALLVVSILGFNFVAIKIGVLEIPPLLLTGLRFFFAGIPVVFFVARPKASFRLVASFGFVLGVVQFGLLFVAIHMGMPAGLSSLVLQMQVFFTIALAFFLLGEQPTVLQILGGCVATGGVAFIAAWKAQGASLVPFVLVLGAALAWGVANIITKRAGRIDMLAYIVWASLIPPLPLFALSLLIEGPNAVSTALTHLTWTAAGCVAFLAYPTTVFAFALWSGLLSRYSAATVTPFALLVPVAGILSTSLVLGEPFGRIEIIGSILVFIGLGLNIVSSRLAVAAAAIRQSRTA